MEIRPEKAKFCELGPCLPAPQQEKAIPRQGAVEKEGESCEQHPCPEGTINSLGESSAINTSPYGYSTSNFHPAQLYILSFIEIQHVVVKKCFGSEDLLFAACVSGSKPVMAYINITFVPDFLVQPQSPMGFCLTHSCLDKGVQAQSYFGNIFQLC